jgi:SSS family solute:Na+ symporter
MTITTLDAAVIASYLVIVVLLGLWTGRGNRDLAGYLLGDKRLPWWALLGSIVATETSTATFLSVPGIAFEPNGDLRFLQLALGFIVGRCLIVVLLLPAYFRGEILTAYEVLEVRFGGPTKRTAALLFLVSRTLGDGLRLFLTALALEKAVGLSLPLCIVLIAAVTLLYTWFGGMRSVVWNDCLQLVVYLAGGLLALWIILDRLPEGWQQVQAFAAENGKWRMFDWDWHLNKPFTFWAGLVGGACLSLGTHGTDQMMVQRLLAARSQRDAARALVCSGVVVSLACYFRQFPPPVPIARGDEAFATFIVGHMPPGAGGFTLAAVLAAAMSTIASSLNSSAATAVNDLGPQLGLGNLSATARLIWCRRITVVFCLLQIGVAWAARYHSKSVVNDALAIAGFVTGILLGVFLLGVLTTSVRQGAAAVGMVTGMVAVGVAKFGTDLAWPWYPVVGAGVSLAAGILASLAFRRAS